jgi:hypothetical protein
MKLFVLLMYAIANGAPEFAPFTYYESMAECKEKETALVALADKVHVKVRTGCYAVDPEMFKDK